MLRKKLLRATLAVLLVCTLLLPLASCALFGGGKNDKPLQISGEEGALCRVIYPSANNGTPWRSLANSLSKAIRRITGIVVEVAPDTEEESDTEILLGSTNRLLSGEQTEALSALSASAPSFAFAARDGKFSIVATDAATMELAISYFEMQYDGTLGGSLEGSALSLPGSLSLTHTVTPAASAPADLLPLRSPAPELVVGKSFDIAASDNCRTLTALTARGEVLYAALTDGAGGTRLVKLGLTDGKLLQASDVLPLGGAVSMCYNAVLDLLTVVHGNGSREVSLVHPETLTLHRTETVEHALDAITWSENSNQYIARVAGEARLVFLSNYLAELSATDLKEISAEAMPAGTVTLCDLTADGSFAYLLYTVTAENAATRSILTLLSLDGSQRRYVKELELGGATPLSLCCGGRAFYVAVPGGESHAASLKQLSLTAKNGAGEPSSLFHSAAIKKEDTSYLATAQLFRVYDLIKAEYARNTVLQGACTDGTFGYFFMEYQGGSGNYSNSETHDTVIVKMRMSDGSLVKYSKPLKLGHSNDGCYNPLTNRLIVAYNGNDATRVVLIDPDTLEITGEKHLPLKIFSIAYNETTGQYVVGRSGGRDFSVLDADFEVFSTHYAGKQVPEVIKDYTLGETLLTQGIDCDSQYIYFVLSGRNGSSWIDYLLAYDWNGNLVFTKTLPGLTREIENIFHIGNEIYVSCNGGNAPCYRLTVKSEASK